LTNGTDVTNANTFILQHFIFLFIAISLSSIALGMLKPLTLRSFDRLFLGNFLICKLFINQNFNTQSPLCGTGKPAVYFLHFITKCSAESRQIFIYLLNQGVALG